MATHMPRVQNSSCSSLQRCHSLICQQPDVCGLHVAKIVGAPKNETGPTGLVATAVLIKLYALCRRGKQISFKKEQDKFKRALGPK